MPLTNSNILAQLQREILPLQGLKSTPRTLAMDVGWGPIKYAFPNATFPTGAIHEFYYDQAEQATASCGFIAGLTSVLMQNGGAALWISAHRMIFPPALKSFGIEPDKMIFLDLKKEKDVLPAMDEALKCDCLATVVGEIKDLGFTESRRLQLAVEQSRVTAFVIHPVQPISKITACVTRWKITPLPSVLPNGMPGVGFPRWNVELLKVRNGKPGSWQLEWIAGRFRHVPVISSIYTQQKKKAG